jgi:hypothetical protein
MNKIVNFYNHDDNKDIAKIVFVIAFTVCTINSKKITINSKALFKSFSQDKEYNEFYNVRKYFTISNFDKIAPHNAMFDYTFLISSPINDCDILICVYDLKKSDFSKIKSSLLTCLKKKIKTYILLLNYEKKYIKIYSEVAKTYDYVQLFSFSNADIAKIDVEKLINEKMPLSNWMLKLIKKLT